MTETRVVLIGGTSNVGKSTVAQHLAARLGWAYHSTDMLARHPGRPWKPKPEALPPNVVEHYSTLSTDELLASVLAHYRNIWPLALAKIRLHLDDKSQQPLVFEGSGLLPELVAKLGLPGVSAIWLTGSDALFEARIHAGSAYHEADSLGAHLVDKFLGRTRAYNAMMLESLKEFGLPHVDVEEAESLDALADLCLARMTPPFVCGAR